MKKNEKGQIIHIEYEFLEGKIMKTMPVSHNCIFYVYSVLELNYKLMPKRIEDWKEMFCQ